MGKQFQAKRYETSISDVGEQADAEHGAEEGPDYRGPDYRGLGPRGYSRTDEIIRANICEHFCEDPDLDASDIEVSIRDGAVCLAGSVRNAWSRRHAEEVAASISGVGTIQNDLRVDSESGVH